MKTAFCIYGLPGSGKSTFVSLAEENDIPAVIMGDVVREKAAEELDTDNVTGQDIGEWATEQREKYGPDIMAEYTAERVQAIDSDVVVVEGVRSKSELNVFESTFDVQTVHIEADFDTRLQRLQDRDDDRAELSEDGVTAEELTKREERELDWGMDELLESDADYLVDNTHSLGEYQTRITDILPS